ncbi:MarR family winged helix-turn-helix transcriptional regulator [Rhizobium sp. CSW-27]|uniref:MarR family winged helix-turn-helix transcriptional regulator n=1 Tax=Rhizobium sp. CSW-27 TaxID=2839985 RepID=UPI001C021957|nr:MarR family winged helix-turn-helix transcriptional regulator [Rhizobium sp. CSW-27]MBT9368473.1 MarR family winged helix-turn-helix transcriptional regulator [Rhizobium sp. CSW-27]
MSRPSLNERLFDEMSAFNRRLRALFDLRARETGLTLARARALFALSRRGSLSQKDLAQELEIETPTLVRLLDGMEKQNLIERRAGGGDRRVKEIHVTPEGETVGQQVQMLARDLRNRLVDGIPEQDLEVALRVLLQLNRNLAVSSAEEQTS